MSMFHKRLAVLAVLVAGGGAGIAQAQTPYEPQTSPSPTPTPVVTPVPTTVLPTTVVKVPPTPNERAEKAATAIAGAFKGITRKNLDTGTKLTLTINGEGSSIVQFAVTKKGKKTYQVIGKLHLSADGTSHKVKLTLGKVGKARLAAAASKGKTFKMKITIAIYSPRGTGKASETVTVRG